MKKYHIAWVLLLSMSFAPYVHAVVAWDPVKTSPQFDRVLAIDLDADGTLNAQTILAGNDGFIVKEVPDSFVQSSGDNSALIKQDKNYLVLNNLDQLRVMDSNRSGKVDFYDPAFFKLGVALYKPDHGITVQKLIDAKIVEISLPAKPAIQFSAQQSSKQALRELHGQVMDFQQ